MSESESISEENRELQLAVKELSVLNDIATTISSTQPVEEIIDQIVWKCIDHLGVEEAIVSLLDPESDEQHFQTMIRRQASSAHSMPHKLDTRLTGWMIKNREILLSNDIRQDERFRFLKEDSYTFRSLLCVPLMVKGELIGYLAVFDKKDDSPFHQEDRRLLSIIGSQSAQVIENARLYEEEKELIALQEEMRMARDIQLNLLPDREPELAGFQISAVNIPAKSVGGDYYDFLSLDGSRMGFCIGDITGKGMPAAMLMSNLQATFRSQALTTTDCARCLEDTNRQLFLSTEPAKFASFFYGMINSESHTLEYANGGHDAPLWFRNGKDEPQRLGPTGLLLGVMKDSEYERDSIRLSKGDLLVLYSDGITESKNSRDEEFGMDKLISTVGTNRENSASEISEAILQAVEDHAEGTSQSDDITLMVLKKS